MVPHPRGRTRIWRRASTDRLAQLIDQFRGGDSRALRRLTDYLHRLASGFGQGLRRTRSLGPPPGPDGGYGQAYLAAAAQIITAIRRLGDAVSRLDSQGIRTETTLVKSTTAAAQSAAARYGFPTCGAVRASSPSAGGPLA